MDKKTATKNVITVFLIVLLVIGIWQLNVLNKKLFLSQNKLRHIQTEIDLEKKQYESQIQGLNSEIVFRNKNLEATSLELAQTIKQLEATTQELTSAKKQLEKLKVLETENANLYQTRQKLAQKIFDLQTEKQATEAKLHSLAELRKLIRQVKTEIHQQNIQLNLEKKNQQEAIEKEETSRGNKGFIIKNRKSTYKSTFRIEVKPGS